MGGTDSVIKSDSTEPNHLKSTRWLVGIVFAIWLSGLLFMAVRTTNLAVLNPRQIDRASLIVTGTPVDVRSGLVSVERVWKGSWDEEKVAIDDLARTPAGNGERWIFPLIESPQGDGTFAIAPYSESVRGQGPMHPQGRLIYPASPSLEQQLKSQLELDFE